MAAFETVSKLQIRPYERETVIDIRTTRLDSVLSEDSLNIFDPRDHRSPKKPIKVWMAYFNLMRVGLGAGVLGIPQAFSQSGIIFGPILAIGTAFLIIHTHITLLNILNTISSHLRIENISYRYGFRLALLHGPAILRPLGSKGPTIIPLFMILSQMGICSVCVIFTTDSLRDIVDWETNRPAIMTLIVPYLILMYFMTNLKIVSYTTLIGALFNMLGLLLVLYQILLYRPHVKVVDIRVEPLPVMFSFGTFLFNLSAVGVTLSLDKNLINPRVMIKRNGVMPVGIMVPAVVAILFGILGYWSFGPMEENILRSLPYEDNISMVAIGLYLIAIALSYPIQCFPGIAIIMEILNNIGRGSDYGGYSRDPQVEACLEAVTRPLFVLLTFCICYFVPFQGPFVAFVGCICTSMLSLVFPALMDVSMMYPGPYGKYNFYLIKNLVIVCIGIGTLVFGTFLCGYLIYIRIISNRSIHTEDF